MERRTFVTLLGGAVAAWPIAPRAEQPSTIQKVGFLYPGPSAAAPARIDAFSEGLRAAGYRVPGQVEIISRFAENDPTRLAPLAQELIEQNVVVIAAVSAGAANAVRAATTAVPIVALDLETDPVATGMIKSLAHPGANLTGFFFRFSRVQNETAGASEGSRSEPFQNCGDMGSQHGSRAIGVGGGGCGGNEAEAGEVRSA
jgi:putative tryptophan/tyrosine transport system substrate-binding protein